MASLLREYYCALILTSVLLIWCLCVLISYGVSANNTSPESHDSTQEEDVCVCVTLSSKVNQVSMDVLTHMQFIISYKFCGICNSDC